MPTAYALHIGLNKYSSEYYPETVNRLNFCVNDMEAMKKISLAAEFPPQQICTLADSQALQQEVQKKLVKIRDAMKEGDLFLFTYAGHGFQRPDDDGEEIDRLDECICLYDGLMFDDMLNAILVTFPENTRIVCYFDSCHSGSAIKLHLFGQERGLSEEEEKWVFKKHRRKITTDLKEAQIQLLDGYQAAIASFAACRDDEKALESNGHGHFTRAIIDTFNGGSFKGSYLEFFKKVVEKMPQGQHPFPLMLPTSSKVYGGFLKNDHFLSL